MIFPRYLVHLSAFLSFLLLSPTSAHDKKLPVDLKGSFSTVYAFGDSYTDTGNAKFLGGFNASVDANNIPLEKLKSLAQGAFGALGGNHMSRLSNGKLVVDFLCDALSLATPAPYKDPSANFSAGVNFAIAGSTSIPRDYFLGKNLSSFIWNGLPKSFQTQMEWFNDFQIKAGCKGKNSASCKAQMQNSLFWIGEMGVNDYTRSVGSPVSLQWLSEISVRTVCKLLKKYQIEEPIKACCGSGETGSNLNFNKHKLCGSPGATVCKDPSKFISWDGIHLTEAMYKHLSDLFLNQGFCQPSFDELIKRKTCM